MLYVNSTYTFDCGVDMEVLSPSRGEISVKDVTMVMAFSNIFLDPVIYITQYDVVRHSLVAFWKKIAAKFKSQQQPTTMY